MEIEEREEWVGQIKGGRKEGQRERESEGRGKGMEKGKGWMEREGIYLSHSRKGKGGRREERNGKGEIVRKETERKGMEKGGIGKNEGTNMHPHIHTKLGNYIS